MISPKNHDFDYKMSIYCCDLLDGQEGITEHKPHRDNIPKHEYSNTVQAGLSCVLP